MNCKLILLVLALTCAWVLAEEVAKPKQSGLLDGAVVAEDEDDDDDYDDDYDYALGKKGDKIKHKHKKHKLYLLGGGLAAFVALKIKIILVVVTIIGIIGFGLKVFGALKYAGYLGSCDCPVIREQPVYEAGYSATPPPSDHYHYGNDWSSGSYARSFVDNYLDTEFISHAFQKLDMAEMMFAALEMEDDQCRRRMVCEMDAKTRKIPLLDKAMRYFSNGFEKYRNTESETNFGDCAKLYPECPDHEETSERRRRSTKTKRSRGNATS